MTSDPSHKIRAQYDAYPYPPRNPEDDRVRLLPTMLDALPSINHYCFAGRGDFRRDFRVLVAGGGTGDATVYLADQLRETSATVVHYDLSENAMRVARARAAARGLEDRVEWLQGDIRDLPSKDLGTFDYINCSGVLHHMPDPIEGLRALTKMLARGGGMGIMVYGLYGRTGVYQLQGLLRMLNHDAEDDAARLERARAVLGALPRSNWFRRAASAFPMPEDLKTDAGIYDLLLHPVDHAFTVGELYSGLGHAGLRLAAFAPDYRNLYDPFRVIRSESIAESVAALSQPRQQAIAELFWGSISKHVFWASAGAPNIASWYDLDNVPFFFGPVAVNPLEIRDAVRNVKAGQPCVIRIDRPDSPPIDVEFMMTPAAERFLSHVDNSRTLAELFEVTLGDLEPEKRSDAVGDVYRAIEVLKTCDLLLLRHHSVDPINLTAGEA